MTAFGPTRFTGDTKSPDRVDALVWAITDLLLTRRAEPSVRSL
jgi:phage terminase large subunit-like protein